MAPQKRALCLSPDKQRCCGCLWSGNGDACGCGTEVMIVDSSRGSFPLCAGVLEVTNQLPLLGIHAQNRISALLELIPLPAEITELAVAVGSGTGRDRLAVGTQAILHLPQEPAYGIAADRDPQQIKLPGDLSGGFPGPLDTTDRIAGSFLLHQLVDSVDHCGR